jgi:hypothetical protein
MLVDVDGCSLMTCNAAWRLEQGSPAASSARDFIVSRGAMPVGHIEV